MWLGLDVPETKVLEPFDLSPNFNPFDPVQVAFCAERFSQQFGSHDGGRRGLAIRNRLSIIFLGWHRTHLPI